MTTDALIIGGGPAGLMAADVISAAGYDVTVLEAKPSLARKFLMAGKSGLNVTKDEPDLDFLENFSESKERLGPILLSFGPQQVISWVEGLGQPVFTGSSGRVFPTAMKASPLLRAWIARLVEQGVTFHLNTRWDCRLGSEIHALSANGPMLFTPQVTVLAMGGASWPRLGSDGLWAPCLVDQGVSVAPFEPSNMSLNVVWSQHMAPRYGEPLKGVAFQAGKYHSRGEAVITANGLEGGGIYAVSRGVREGADLTIDLCPDLTMDQVEQRLNKPRAKQSIANHIRRVLGLDKAKTSLLFEYGLKDDLARSIKCLTITGATVANIDRAISVAGGIRWSELDSDLRLRKGIYCAGEMIDWEAPTGGYLLTACFATGSWAGHAAVRDLRGT